MDRKWSYLAIFLLCAHASQAAVVNRAEIAVNTYDNLPDDKGVGYEKIEENEIINELDTVYGLYPPKVNAKDYYASKSSYPNKGESPKEEYVIDTVNKVLKLNTEEVSHETKLKPVEETEIKKLSAAFAQIFENSKLENIDWSSQTQTEPTSGSISPEVSTKDWRKLNPIITVSKSGVSIAFANETVPEKEEATEQAVEDDKDPMRDSLWEALAKSVDRTLVDELDRRLNVTEEENAATDDFLTEEEPPKEEEQQQQQSALTKFISSVWNVMKTSLDYIGAFFSSLMSTGEPTQTEVGNPTSEETKTEEDGEKVTLPPTTTVAVFAYEEPTRYKRLPAEEFETRRRDIDSLFYGYGIV